MHDFIAWHHEHPVVFAHVVEVVRVVQSVPRLVGPVEETDLSPHSQLIP